MAAQRGQGPFWGLERQGPGFCQKAGYEPQAARAKPEEQKGRGPQEKLLRSNGRDARTNEGRERSSDSKSSSLEEVEMLTWETLT
jgi:hypothetical protein